MSTEELALRHRVIEHTLTHSQELFAKHPEILPELGEGYAERAVAYLGGLYVPNMDIDPASGQVRLTTPEQYKGSDMLGVVALRTGETVFLDDELCTPTEQQRENMTKFLASDPRGEHIEPVQAVEGAVRFMHDILPYGGIAHPDGFAARVIAHGFTTASSKRTMPGLQGSNAMTINSRPLMVLDVRDGTTLLSSSSVAHETDHALEFVDSPIRPNTGINRLLSRVRSELRGYHVGAHAVRALDALGYNESGNSQIDWRVTEFIDRVRAEHCPPDDPFKPTEEVLNAMGDKLIEHITG